jgi:hypothetical protein
MHQKWEQKEWKISKSYQCKEFQVGTLKFLSQPDVGYELFLKDLVKFTDEDHPDFKNLCQALFKIRDVASKINESKRLAENLNKILEIQSKMGQDNLVQPFRRFVMEGDLVYHKPLVSWR